MDLIGRPIFNYTWEGDAGQFKHLNWVPGTMPLSPKKFSLPTAEVKMRWMQNKLVIEPPVSCKPTVEPVTYGITIWKLNAETLLVDGPCFKVPLDEHSTMANSVAITVFDLDIAQNYLVSLTMAVNQHATVTAFSYGPFYVLPNPTGFDTDAVYVELNEETTLITFLRNARKPPPAVAGGCEMNRRSQISNIGAKNRPHLDRVSSSDSGTPARHVGQAASYCPANSGSGAIDIASDHSPDTASFDFFDDFSSLATSTIHSTSVENSPFFGSSDVNAASNPSDMLTLHGTNVASSSPALCRSSSTVASSTGDASASSGVHIASSNPTVSHGDISTVEQRLADAYLKQLPHPFCNNKPDRNPLNVNGMLTKVNTVPDMENCVQTRKKVALRYLEFAVSHRLHTIYGYSLMQPSYYPMSLSVLPENVPIPIIPSSEHVEDMIGKPIFSYTWQREAGRFKRLIWVPLPPFTKLRNFFIPMEMVLLDWVQGVLLITLPTTCTPVRVPNRYGVTIWQLKTDSSQTDGPCLNVPLSDFKTMAPSVSIRISNLNATESYLISLTVVIEQMSHLTVVSYGPFHVLPESTGRDVEGAFSEFDQDSTLLRFLRNNRNQDVSSVAAPKVTAKHINRLRYKGVLQVLRGTS